MNTHLKMLVLFCFVVGNIGIELHALELPRRSSYPKGYYVFNDSADIGFGAVLMALLPLLDRYDSGQYSGIKVDLDSGCYLDADLGPNWWNYFFEPIDLGDRSGTHYSFSKKQMMQMYRSGVGISRQRSAELFERYVHLKPAVQEEINEFYDRNMRGYYIIGVHHRGTDKKTETVVIPHVKTLQFLQQVIAQLPKDTLDSFRIFVATDDDAFINFMVSAYPSRVIYNDFIRSANNKPLHYSEDKYGSNYQKGKEALIDLIMLSMCDHLVYPSASSFSTISMKLNPSLPLTPIKPNPLWR